MKKTVVIAGGAKSLGKFLAVKFNEKDYNTVVLDNDLKNLKILESEFPKIKAIQCDLTSEEDVKNSFDIISVDYDSLDIVVYNAGYAKSQKIDSFDYLEFDKCQKINLYGYFLVAKYAAQVMLKKQCNGNIMQINSKSGRVGSKHNSGYSAAKFGGVGLTQSLALDLAEHNIRVNCMMLGNLLDSEMFESLIPQYAKKLSIPEKDVKDYYIQKVPLKRGCSFDDVFNVLYFYTSELANYCTGQSINLTGGQVM